MKNTIVTPITNTFNSFDALKDSALPLGTKVSFDLKNGNRVTFELAHKNAYGATNIYVIADCYGKHRMNDTPTNKGGWNACDMRRHLREGIVPLLPDDLLKLIIPRGIRQKLKGQIIEPTGGSDAIWVPSYTEMVGLDIDGDNAQQCEVDIDDVHFDLYDTEKSRVKELDPHGTWWYWLRSATASNSSHLEGVYNGGGANNYLASFSNGVCFGFCI